MTSAEDEGEAARPRSAPVRRESAEGTQSIRRALAILDVLAEGRDRGIRLADVARRTGVSRPTIHRILRVLVEEGVVEQHDDTRRYAIGEQVRMLALARASRSPLLNAADPVLQRAGDRLGDTLFLTVRVGLDTLCVARRPGKYPVQVLMIDVGERRPLGVSSAGVAMLATLEQREIEDIVAQNAERFRPYRITPARVLSLVDDVRGKGFVLRQRGLVKGTKVVSVAIPATAESPLAALSAAGVDHRMTPARIGEIVGHLGECTAAILKSLRAGAPP